MCFIRLDRAVTLVAQHPARQVTAVIEIDEVRDVVHLVPHQRFTRLPVFEQRVDPGRRVPSSFFGWTWLWQFMHVEAGGTVA